jgi:hypothetical protein
MTPRKAEALTLLLPLTLVVPLLWHDLVPGTLSSAIAPTGLATLALGGAAFAFGARYFRPGYSLESNRWGLVLGLAAISVYFLGSVRSTADLHWAAGGLLYLGAVIYVGGPFFAVVALPAVAAVVAVASGLAQDMFVEVPLSVALMTYVAATFRLDPSRGAMCAHCEEQIGKGSSYCSSCSRRLSLPSVRLGRAKLGHVVLTSLVIVMLALAQPVAFNVTQSGINYTTYTVGGIRVQPLINTLPPGWHVANSTQSSSAAGTSMSYVLASARSSVALLVSLSATPDYAPSIIPGNFSKASIVGNVVVGTQSLTKYGLTTNSSASYTGLVWSAPISYLSGGQVSTGLLSFLAAEPTPAYTASRGVDLVAISSSVLTRLGAPQLWSLPLVGIGSYILEYDSYIIPSIGPIAVLLFVGSLRGRELRESRVVDGTFALSSAEFSLYATLARAAPLQTGAEYEATAVSMGVWNRSDFCTELGRLERLGLMKSHVRVRGGIPRLLWKCELA